MDELLDGGKIFKLMDTTGLPLEIINDILREKGRGFNVIEFVDAALASKNFTYEKVKGKLISCILLGDREEFKAELDRIASTKGWNAHQT